MHGLTALLYVWSNSMASLLISYGLFTLAQYYHMKRALAREDKLPCLHRTAYTPAAYGMQALRKDQELQMLMREIFDLCQ